MLAIVQMPVPSLQLPRHFLYYGYTRSEGLHHIFFKCGIHVVQLHLGVLSARGKHRSELGGDLCVACGQFDHFASLPWCHRLKLVCLRYLAHHVDN